MKALVAVVLILLAVGIVLGVMYFHPAPKPPPPRVSVPKPAKVTAPLASPSETVKTYLGALYEKNYRTAYNQLSAASQQAHPYDEFVKLNEEKGMTQFDLTSAKQEAGGEEEAVVSVSVKEDVAQHGFRLVQEEGVWKIVFLKGTPSFPYGE